MYQNKSILKSKKLHYALFFITILVILSLLPTAFHLNAQTVRGLRLVEIGIIAIAGFVIGGYSLTDSFALFVKTRQFKELVSEFSPIIEAAGIDQEVQDTILSFLKENGVTIE